MIVKRKFWSHKLKDETKTPIQYIGGHSEYIN